MKTEQTSRGLAAMMFDEIDKLRNGESTPQRLSAIARGANTICSVSRLEMDYARFVSDSQADEKESRMKALPMGNVKKLRA